MALFEVTDRDEVRSSLLDLARSDQRIVAAALTGSAARGEEDRWSDIDLAFGVGAEHLLDVLDDWTSLMRSEFGAMHLLDVRPGASVYRVFLLAGSLQVDLAFMPVAEFRAVGPSFRLVFGEAAPPIEGPQSSARQLIGMGTLFLIHADVAIKRNRPWQAEYFICGLREHAFALACARYGVESSYGRGYDSLPDDFLDRLRGGMPASLDATDLALALAVTASAFFTEARHADGELVALIDGASVADRVRARP